MFVLLPLIVLIATVRELPSSNERSDASNTLPKAPAIYRNNKTSSNNEKLSNKSFWQRNLLKSINQQGSTSIQTASLY